MSVTDVPPARVPAPAKPPREDDPRYPLTRLSALLDEGSIELLSAIDDSGMLAVRGSVDGATHRYTWKEPPVPYFVLGFLAVGGLNSLGWLAAPVRSSFPISTFATSRM